MTKPKVRTFMKFKDFFNVPAYLGKPLSFVERRTISKLRLGNLPISLETARYLRPVIPEDQRLCYCGSEVESEYHVLFKCVKYSKLRDAWLNELCIPYNFNDIGENEQLKYVLNNSELTARFLVTVMDLRSTLTRT